MIQISSQQSQLGYEYERLQERQVVAVAGESQLSDKTVGQRPQQLNETQSLSQDSFEVELTPAQLIKKRLIESINTSESADFETTKPSFVAYAEEYDYRSLIKIAANGQPPDNQAIADDSLLYVKERLYEYERMDYSTQFQFQSGDGSSISMAFSLTYEREIDIQRESLMTGAEFKDPLVLNLKQRPDLFSDSSSEFDLDGDGQTELIPQLQNGVWYLAFDRNENGKIDNGLELFGARTGQGFTELSQLDSNQNGVIEGDDLAYQSLQLWDGQEKLKSLSDAGVKAISLNATDTPFTFTDESARPKAQLRQTSVFVTEENKLGAIHQVDIAV